MKKTLSICFFLFAALTAIQAQTWDMTTISSADKALLAADATHWTYETAKDRYATATPLSEAAIVAGGTELQLTKGLRFTTNKGNLRIDIKGKRLWLNGTMIINGAKAGQRVTVVCKSSGKKDARTITTSNLTAVSGLKAATMSTEQTGTGIVEADGSVRLTTTGAMYVTLLKLQDASGKDEDPHGGNINKPENNHSVAADASQNQLRLTLTDGTLYYYNTAAVASVDINNTTGKVTVVGNTTGTTDELTNTVAAIDMVKKKNEIPKGQFTNTEGRVYIKEARGWHESAYLTWNLLPGATNYHVYVKEAPATNYTRIDQALVRNYGTYGRADVVGLKAGSYVMKVVPIINGNEIDAQANEAYQLDVVPYQREGFAHFNQSEGVGAYQNNGQLKTGARVLYVTAQTAKTVSCTVTTNNKGATSTFTGLQTILDAYCKGYDSTPLAIRFIGTVTLGDLDHISSSAEGIQIKNNKSGNLNITIEGIGDDAVTSGFGFLLRNAANVEIRNLANMLCKDDAISIDTDNRHIWVHHLDLFYGNAGGDADQAKGDGTIDIKGNSQYVTVDHNRFWDNGKSSLCGMTSESGPNYITYHHNWFDHSDSRHPRIRTMSVHIWNNYYDGCAKYGVGAVAGADAFVDRNYFRAVSKPMLINHQGTDAKGNGTFEDATGGMIKSYGNVFAEKPNYFSFITHKQNATDFDAYEAEAPNEQVPSNYQAKAGGEGYNNFDTTPSLMYSYTPDAAADVPANVTGYYGAGRLNHGDFKYTITGDADYNVDTKLKTALQNYKSQLVGGFVNE